MSLSPGSKLGSYEILSLLGAGGMGEVYRARDNRLGRDVAIKVLPAERMADEGRRRRFVQEARAASTLNHPNIVTIHEIESADGIDFIVMEYVPGQSLDALIPKSGMRLAEVLRTAIPIADALAAAHSRSIVHRDLKPANVAVTDEGVVKVLDFGLAKLVFQDEGNDEHETATHDAAAGPLSHAGAIAGTAGYMSPEQATGGKVDARSDVFSFGSMLYEMVTGRRAFAGSSTAETLAAVVRQEPKPPSELAPGLPKQLEKLILRCLMKEPERRAQHMSDVRVELLEIREESDSKPAASTVPATRKHPWRVTAGFGAFALILGLAGGWALRRPLDKAGQRVNRLSLALPNGTQLADSVPSVAISRDGSRLAVAARRGRVQELYTRALQGWEWKRLPGTEGAQSPFFSPDGEWVGFFTSGRLNRVSVSGGTPQVVCNVRAASVGGTTGSWGDDGWVVYAGWPAPGLWRCPAGGGTPEQLTGLEPGATRQVQYRTPRFLPGGRSVLFGTWTAGRAQVEALSLHSAQRRVLITAGADASYAATGHILFGWDNQILAVPFDSQRLAIHGVPVPVVEAVRQTTRAWPSVSADYAVSETGTLVYAAGTKTEKRLVWVDRTGQISALPFPSGDYSFPALSPDGKRVALGIAKGASRDVWIGDLVRGTLSRLTSDGDAVFSLWSRDGRFVLYASSQPGQYNIFRKNTDGSGPPERLTNSDHSQRATSWSPDERLLLFHENDPVTFSDIWLLPLDGDRKPFSFVKTAAIDQGAMFSPDGRWIAYQSEESGRLEVYVQAYPGPGPKSQVSTEGGAHPSWNTNGRELFYAAGDQLLSVPVDTGEGLRLGTPRLLFRAGLVAKAFPGRQFDMTPDGQRFLFLDDVTPEAPANQLHVVVNWFEELSQRVPVIR